MRDHQHQMLGSDVEQMALTVRIRVTHRKSVTRIERNGAIPNIVDFLPPGLDVHDQLPIPKLIALASSSMSTLSKYRSEKS